MRAGQLFAVLVLFFAILGTLHPLSAQNKRRAKEPVIPYPPTLPDNKPSVTDQDSAFLKPSAPLQKGVRIAQTAPTIDFIYYPGQTYAGRPWSNWGDSLAVGDKYYASIGDHLAPRGNAFVYEYDAAKKTFRQLLDVEELLNLPEGHYTPGKIHGRLDLGSDGWLYCSTHRGSTRVTTDEYHYKGDWIIRVHPKTGQAEVVVQGPVSKHCIPNSLLDPKRMIFYGGTAPGQKDDPRGIRFFAYDVKNHKLLYEGPHGPKRYMALASSTGNLYYVPDTVGPGELLRYDPAKPNAEPQKVGVTIGIRAATQETDDGFIYTCSQDRGEGGSHLYALNTRTEEVTDLGPLAVASQSYVASLDVDPTGRYLYYVPGAHGGGFRDGSPVVQFDVKKRTRKVIAFLHPFYEQKYGAIPKGTYSTAVSPSGDKLYITWNVSRGSRAWDCCALTVVHIPESERTE